MGNARLTSLDLKFAEIAAGRGYVTSEELDRALGALERSREVSGGRDILPKVIFEMNLMSWDQIDHVFRKMFGARGRRKQTWPGTGASVGEEIKATA